MDVGVRTVKVFRQFEWKASQTFVVSCGLPLRDAQRLDGNGASYSIQFSGNCQPTIDISVHLASFRCSLRQSGRLFLLDCEKWDHMVYGK